MLTFDVEGMTCGHCVEAVARAVKALDPAAEVKVDLPAGQVLAQTRAEARAVAAAIEEAGYKVKPF